jgi:type I restriction enzyme S subunit
MITDGSHFSPKEEKSSYYMASVKDMRYNYFDFSNCKTISYSHFNSLIDSNCSPMNGDILISKDGANCLDIIFVYKQPIQIVLLSSIAIARLKKGYDPYFYRYYLLSPSAQYLMRNNLVSGSAIPRVILKDFRKVLVPILPLKEQIAISSLLKSLDDKIDLLHRQNKTLEQLAETVFNEKIKTKSEKWEVGKLGDEFDFTMGQSPPGESYNEIGNGMIFFQGRTDFGFRFPEIRLYTTDPKRFAKKFETLISVRAPVGDMNIAFDDCCIGRGLSSFRYKKNPNFFSYTFYKLKSIKDEIAQFEDNGTVFGAITKDDFAKIEIGIPSIEAVKEINEILSSIDNKIFANHKQISTLQKLRDTLLPKLMSGEVRVLSEK